jgi:hypothetical protein
VERTRLEGVAEPVILHANHAELIRAPLLFTDPGPVACMTDLLRFLKEDREHIREGSRSDSEGVGVRPGAEARRSVQKSIKLSFS